MADTSSQRRAVPSNTGNSRVTVAFPFSRIDIRDPEPALTDLAALVRDLAEYVAALPTDRTAEQAQRADHLVAEAKRVASGLGAT